MRKVYSTTAGATFHQETPNYTFCFRKECIEAIIKMSPGEYVIINMTHTRDGHLLLFTNWGNYFNRMQNPAVQMPRIEKNCPTLYKVLVGEDPDNVREMVFGGKGHEMHGLGINLDSSVKIPIMLELDEKIMKTILRKNTLVLAKRIPVLPMNILVMLRNLVTTNLHQAA